MLCHKSIGQQHKLLNEMIRVAGDVRVASDRGVAGLVQLNPELCLEEKTHKNVTSVTSDVTHKHVAAVTCDV